MWSSSARRNSKMWDRLWKTKEKEDKKRKKEKETASIGQMEE